MATYKEIQDWIKGNYHVSVKSCWIAHVKEIEGLHPRRAANRFPGAERSNPCPEDKKEIIRYALEHFGMNINFRAFE